MKESKVANGRIGIHVPDHPKANSSGYVLRSRYVMEQYLGRYLDSIEHVHHCNEDRFDDSIGNLELTLIGTHMLDYHNNLGDNRGPKRTLDHDFIRSLNIKGLSSRKIAKIVGCNDRTVRNICVDIPKNYTRSFKLDYTIIKELREEGYGYTEISKRTGYNRSSIRYACSKMKKNT